jgi:hypothetical protein
MTNYKQVSRSTHGNRRWQRFSFHQFAAKDSVAALVAHEMGVACINLPLAFIWQSERFLPVAVQGFERDMNLFVAPDGRWLGRYTPAGYRSYPFALGKAAEGQLVLCVAEDSGLIFDGDTAPSNGSDVSRLRFFADDGQLDPAVSEVLSFLEKTQSSREATERICAALNAEGLLVPWAIQIKVPDGKRKLEGLYRVDEAKLQNLSGDSLKKLNQVGALSVAYCQLVSMHNIQLLATLAQLHHSSDKLQTEAKVDEVLGSVNTLRFS